MSISASSQKLLLGHLLVNAILLGLAYYWLGIGESKVATVTWSACLLALILGIGCCAYGAAMAYFRTSEDRTAIGAWKVACRNLIPLAVAVVLVGWIYWMLDRWAGSLSDSPAFSIASYLSLKLRYPVKPDSVGRVIGVLFGIVRWAVVPVILLPAVSAMAVEGWRGLREVGSRARQWLYWIQAPLLLLCAFWLPLKIVRWVPVAGGFTTEMMSFVARAAVAYLLFTGAWLLLAFATAAGRPRLTQSVTVETP
jgi:hypothetical protein